MMNLLPTDSAKITMKRFCPTTQARKRKRESRKPIQTQTLPSQDERTEKGRNGSLRQSRIKTSMGCQVRREKGGDGERAPV